MEEPIVDPALEFEAPQFVDFNEVNDDEEAYADLWFGKLEILSVHMRFTAAIGDLALLF